MEYPVPLVLHLMVFALSIENVKIVVIFLAVLNRPKQTKQEVSVFIAKAK
jgi:hypothetical protein